MTKYIFFLGGYDAEMVEIRNILEAQGEKFYDKRLSWGACVSAYTEEIKGLPSNAIPVLIELKIDKSIAPNAVIVDHHDEKAGKDRKTSIEQIAELLGIALTRKQKLISANDRGHIRAMREMCATDEEIAEIREMDRKAQGVTEEDERLADESIKKHLEKIGNNAVIVNSKTNKTSAVFDRLNDKYTHIFVLTPDGKMNYSGTGEIVKALNERYERKKKEDPSIKTWSGGNLPDYGFFGTNSPMTKNEIKEILNTPEKKIISQHIFIFPFRITPTPNTNEEASSNELKISHIVESFELGGWEYKPYKVDSCARYSEYYYFHEYVRKAIFEQREIEKDTNHDVISYYFERPVPEDSVMKLHIKGDDNGKSICFDYILKIHRLSLRLFSTYIGVLTIELYNYDYPLLQDILYINEYGRRIYPQFLPDDCDINKVKNTFLANKIEFKCGDINSCEDFLPTVKFLDGQLFVADYITKLLGDSFIKKFRFSPIIDDRMFTVCWYGNDNLIKSLQQPVAGRYKYEISDEWYSFVFIDCSVSGVSAGGKMKEDLIKQFTYSRWIHTGTLYGITRYSLMCLTNTSDFSYNVLRHNMERMYYQMAIILLAQRASILKFSDDVSKISGKIENMKGKNEKERFKEIAEEVKDLHSSFIHFVNRLWFTEVTPQEQGIEMYNMAVKNMGLVEQLNEVRQEIKELHEFVELEYEKMKNEEDREINKRLDLLNKIVFLAIPLTVLAGIFGMNIFEQQDLNLFDKLLPNFPWIGGLVIFFVFAIILYWIVWKKFSWIKEILEKFKID